MDAVAIITDLGFPIAAALGLGMFVWKLINRIIDGMENKLDTLDNKVQKSLDVMEERVSTKLDSQYGIIVSLIDRVRAIDNQSIRQDVLLKTFPACINQKIQTSSLEKSYS
jgi:enoyl reductase-like protein